MDLKTTYKDLDWDSLTNFDISEYMDCQYFIRDLMIEAMRLLQKADKQCNNYHSLINLGHDEYQQMGDLINEALTNLIDVISMCRNIEKNGSKLSDELGAKKDHPEYPEDPLD